MIHVNKFIDNFAYNVALLRLWRNSETFQYNAVGDMFTYKCRVNPLHANKWRSYLTQNFMTIHSVLWIHNNYYDKRFLQTNLQVTTACLLYTSDAADE